MHIQPDVIFSALANETRLRCIALLLSQEELCVCEFTEIVDAAQPNVTRHLGQLRDAGLVVDRRESQWIYYRINPDLTDWVADILAAVGSAAATTNPYQSDRKALARMPARRNMARCA